MKICVVTGVSRGIGESLGQHCLENGYVVHAVGRSISERFLQQANCKFTFCDLEKPEEVEKIAREIFEHCVHAQSVFVINNAAVLDPVVPIQDISSQEFAHAFAVNVTAPVVFMKTFAQQMQGSASVKRVLNVSSGAGLSPRRGWGTYCATKAALNMATQVFALEQENQKYPIRSMAVAPGMVDTDMQIAIRESSTEAFPDREFFMQVYEDGKLRDADSVARAFITLLESEEYGIQDVVARLP